MRRDLALLGLALPSASARAVAGCSAVCSEVSFDVPVTSENVQFSSPPDPNNTTAIVDFMISVWNGTPAATNGTLTVSDTFTIKGTYCTPKDTTTEPKALQILVHGITYNKTMWAGMGFSPADYSWHSAATARGYATLALDRLGHGANPQRPDPLSVVQPQIQIDIMHEIFAGARDAAAPLNSVFGRAYDSVVFVGHSYGAFLGAALGAQHPADADALVLAGYSSYYDFSDMIGASWASAADHDPARFGAGLAKGYIVMADEAQRTETFYVGGYDAAIPPVDFAYEDTLTVGEIGALAAILGPAVGYTGPVLAVTSVEDAFFCEAPKERCEEHLIATADAFPDAVSYDYFAPENTGHDLTLHYTAGETFEQVHDWLDSKL